MYGDQMDVLKKQRYPSPHSMIKVYMVTYLSEGLKVKGFLAIPQQKERYPGILYLRGGIHHVGMVRIPRITQLASEGFVVFAPFYRGNLGGEGHEDFAGEDRHDAISAYRLLSNLPNVICNQIHLFGFSRGGVMALHVALELPSVSSVVTWGGVSDMELTYEERIDLRRMLKRVIGGSPGKVPERYKWRTPLGKLKAIQPPVLIVHGAKDENVSVRHAELLQAELTKENKDVTAWIFEEYDHYFPPKTNRRLVREIVQWMDSKRKKARF
jgi:dipeptidyl aminopeptidase/acylaminoacyl peptidase